jgi:hypothetical protein
VNKFRNVLLFVSSMFLAATYVSAAIVSVDDTVIGADTITFDTQTQLEWLDLDLTSNLSYNAAEAAYSVYGFRHATQVEVAQFFSNAGIPGIDTGTSAANYAPAIDLQSLITCRTGYNSTTESDLCLSHAWTAVEGSYAELSWIYRDDTAMDATVIVDSNNILGSNPDHFDTYAHPARSHWMVRSTVVPLPASLWLFGSALAGLGWLRRKQSI